MARSSDSRVEATAAGQLSSEPHDEGETEEADGASGLPPLPFETAGQVASEAVGNASQEDEPPFAEPSSAPDLAPWEDGAASAGVEAASAEVDATTAEGLVKSNGLPPFPAVAADDVAPPSVPPEAAPRSSVPPPLPSAAMASAPSVPPSVPPSPSRLPPPTPPSSSRGPIPPPSRSRVPPPPVSGRAPPPPPPRKRPPPPSAAPGQPPPPPARSSRRPPPPVPAQAVGAEDEDIIVNEDELLE